MSTNFNPGIVPQGAAPTVGSNPGQRTTQGAEVKVNVPGIASYDPDTKMAGEARPWNKPADKKEVDKKVEPEVKVKPPVTETEAAKSRHEKWKAEQATKKQELELAKNKKQAEKQALAVDFLKQGNITKAAEALGVPVADLITLTQNAALQIKTEDKKLTPAEQQAKEFADYKAAKDQEIANLSQSQYQIVARSWIKDNIDPVMADPKYELINLNKDNAPRFKMAVYEYLDKMHREGKSVSVTEVLDTIEKEAEDHAKKSLTQYKGVKKFKEIFGPDGEVVEAKPKKKKEVPVEEPVEEEIPEAIEDQLGADDVEVEEPVEEEDDDQVYETKNFNVSQSSRKNVPFALMTENEKIKFLQEARRPKKK